MSLVDRKGSITTAAFELIVSLILIGRSIDVCFFVSEFSLMRENVRYLSLVAQLYVRDRLTLHGTVVKRGAEARASNYLDVIETHLKANGPFFLGDRLSASDWPRIAEAERNKAAPIRQRCGRAQEMKQGLHTVQQAAVTSRHSLCIPSDDRG